MAVNGIDTTGASGIASKANKKDINNTLDKDAFLQLLVTQMQYQDPLQPTDNTEYMSQLAQFSELESMNNLNSAYSNSQALNLVGEYVILNTTDASGNVKQEGGLVQYVTVKNNQALLYVNDKYYTMDEFDSVVDWDYIEYLNGSNSATTKPEDTDNSGTEGKEDDKTVSTDEGKE